MDTLALAMAYEIELAITELHAIKQIPKWQRDAEARLTKRLQGVLNAAFTKVIDKLQEMGRIPFGDVARRQLVLAILNSIPEFQDAVAEEGIGAAEQGRFLTLEILQDLGVAIQFTEFSKHTRDILKEHFFEASRATLDRMVGDVMANLTESYESGLGIDDAAEELKKVFTNMEGYELERVARTEINSGQSQGAHRTMVEYGVRYHQWWTAQDERVRHDSKANHREMHGQIVKLGEEFSNGLKRPGDKSGEIEEWINCRCRAVPYLIPKGKAAPIGKSHFYEKDLVSI